MLKSRGVSNIQFTYNNNIQREFRGKNQFVHDPTSIKHNCFSFFVFILFCLLFSCYYNCRHKWLYSCCCQYLATKGEQRELDIEHNKLGNISLLASQEATASHSSELKHFSPKRINTPPFLPLVPGNQVGREEDRPVCN